MVRNSSYMFVTGPDIVKSATHEEVDFEGLGGASIHTEKSGVSHLAGDSEADTLFLVRKLLGYLPQNNMEDAPFVNGGDDPLRTEVALDTIIPDDPGKPYDMHEVIRLVMDKAEFFEVQETYAPNILLGLHGSVGIRSVSLPTNPTSSQVFWTLNLRRRRDALSVFAIRSISRW